MVLEWARPVTQNMWLKKFRLIDINQEIYNWNLIDISYSTLESYKVPLKYVKGLQGTKKWLRLLQTEPLTSEVEPVRTWRDSTFWGFISTRMIHYCRI